MIRVFIVDDHALMREGIKQIINLAEDIEVAGEAESGDLALAKFKKEGLCFDVLMMDIDMPGTHGDALIKKMLEIDHEMKILMVSMHNEAEVVKNKIIAGALGYVSKGAGATDMFTAIRKVFDGKNYLEQDIAIKLALVESSNKGRKPHEDLSGKEFHVLHLYASGMSLVDIGTELHISEKTVSTYKSRLMQKLNVTCNAQLVEYAIKNNLIMERAAAN